MIYLLYGDDTKRSRATLREFEQKFREKSASSWRTFDFVRPEDIQSFVREAGSRNLFASKDYFIIRSVSLLSEDMLDFFKEALVRWADDGSIIVFFEEGIPKKNDFFSLVKKHASKHQEFKTLLSGDAGKWLDAEAKKRGLSLSRQQRDSIIKNYQGDLWQLENELERISAGGGESLGHSILTDKELFALGDMWGGRLRVQALLKYDELVREGFAPERILWTMLWHVKSLCLASQHKTEGMNPYVARKSALQASHFSIEELQVAYRDLVFLDVNEKWGSGSIEFGLFKFFLVR